MRTPRLADVWTNERRQWLYGEFDRITRLPLLLLSLVMIAVVVLPYVLDFDAETQHVFDTTSTLIYAVFVFDFFTKLLLTTRRLHYLKTHPVEILIVALPAFGALRILQGARVLHVLAALRAVAFFLRAIQLLRSILLRRQMPLVLGFTAITILICAGLVSIFEEDQSGPIKNYGDALWWAVTTITTVGYGDTYPVTAEGRGVAFFLMLVGIAFFGVLTANLAAYFVETSSETPQIGEKLDAILERIDRLERRLNDAPGPTRPDLPDPAGARADLAALAEETAELARSRG